MVDPSRLGRIVLGLACALLVACGKGEPDPTPWCSAEAAADLAAAVEAGPAGPPPTWFRDIKPVVDAKCTRCHTPGGLGPFALERWDDFYRRAPIVREAVLTRHMPPWHAARCCTDYHQDTSLTDAELRSFVWWLDSGAPIGDAREEPPPLPKVGGLSRVDVTVDMPEPYVPAPPPGTTDENRCFLLDWPLDQEMYVTGMNPVPGERSVVHHLIVGVLEGDSLEDARALSGKDGRPGFDCTKLRGMGLRDFTVLGGSLLGSDFPDGLGRKIPPRSTILLQVHYSLASSPPKADRTKIEFRVDESAHDFLGLAVANLAWLVGDGMRVKAGEKDAVFFYRYEPTLFTKGKVVGLRSVTPHMHAFASKMVVRVVHEDGRRECLLEIPKWHFGWEQPFWFAKPKRFAPGDEIYLECHFDNSAENQPNGQPPRDIAWGADNQDMCAAFVSFTGGEP